VDEELRALERAGDPRAGRARLRAGLDARASLEDFIQAQSNALAAELIGSVATRRHAAHVFLDGPTGTGKTLLLRALSVARADSFLWTGVDLHERAAAALEWGELLDLPRLLIVDDLTRFEPPLGVLLRRSLHGTTLVAAGSAVTHACAALGGRLVVVGPLEDPGRRELFARTQRRLGAGDPQGELPSVLPRSGFEIEGLARNLALRAAT